MGRGLSSSSSPSHSRSVGSPVVGWVEWLSNQGGGIRRRRRRLEKRSFPLPARRNFIPFTLGPTIGLKGEYMGLQVDSSSTLHSCKKKGKKDGDG